MRKYLLSLVTLFLSTATFTAVVIPTAAQAIEINVDVGCDNPSAWMVQTGWTGPSASKCVATDGRALRMLMQTNNKIYKDHYYDITFDLTRTAGSVRAFFGITMPAAPTGNWVLASSITPIADRFTLGVGQGLLGGAPDFTIAPYNLTGPGISGEDIGSFRLFCNHAKFGMVDPILYPNLTGAGHIHEFVGNTGVQPNWTYTDFRTKGLSSCQNQFDSNAKYPVNSSGYWWPAVEDGVGHVIRENQTLIYYKGPPRPGLNYSTVANPLGGTATVSGTTVTRTSGLAFTGVPNPLYVNGGPFFYAANNLTLVQYTIATVTDADHLTLTTAPGVASGLYSPFPKDIYNAAANQCNDEWGRYPDLTHDQFGNVVDDESRCPQWPHGMTFIFGYNKANGQGRPDVPIDIASGDNGTGAVPSGSQGAIDFVCMKGPNFPGNEAVEISPHYSIITDIMADAAANPTHCPVGSVLHFAYGGPSCWDGKYADSPDHRSHVAYGIRPTIPGSGWLGNQRCPTNIPYPIPQMSVQNYYAIDANFIAQKWRLSIDDMVDGLPAGAGSHMDYKFAWSPTASGLWFTHCVHSHNSCTAGLGDGTQITTATNYNGTGGPCNACAKNRPDRYVSTTEYGMSWDFNTNGTKTVRIKSAGDGVFGFMGKDGFVGNVDNIHVVEVRP